MPRIARVVSFGIAGVCLLLVPVYAAPPQNATVAAGIEAHPQLKARLKPLLPRGMTLEQAADGFHNQGRFIAALHISHDLSIPFGQLKAAMTGAAHDSLNEAVHALKPSANANMAVKMAEDETRADLKAGARKASGHDSGW